MLMTLDSNQIKITSIADIIPKKNIIVLSPHYDDVLFMFSGYILNLKKAGILDTKSFKIKLIFSRSNYQVGARVAYILTLGWNVCNMLLVFDSSKIKIARMNYSAISVICMRFWAKSSVLLGKNQ